MNNIKEKEEIRNNWNNLSQLINHIKNKNISYVGKVRLIKTAIKYYIKLNNNIKLRIKQNKNKNNKYALLIGINYNNTSNQLNGCINDAYNIRSGLINGFGFNEKNITILTDYTKIKPTKQNIINKLTNILQQTKSGDVVVFSYSGHGTNFPALDVSNELSGKDQFIIPIDATSLNDCIMDNELKNIFVNNMKDGVKVFAIIDSCYSGTIFDLKYNYLTDGSLEYINDAIPSINKGQIVCITGSNDNQLSSDASFNNIYAGAMTYALLNTIKNGGVKVSLSTLINSMRTFLKNNGFSQTPQISSDSELDINSTTLLNYLTTKK